MTECKDAIDFAGVDFVFDKQNCERPAWKFCCHRKIQRSLVMFCTYVIAIVTLIASCLLYLVVTLNENDTKHHLVYTLLSFCFGCFVPAPRK